MSCQLILPVFGGQGMSPLGAPDDYPRDDLSDTTTSPSGSLLLEACHAALFEEIGTLSKDIQQQLHICAQDFQDKFSVIYPPKKTYREDPVLSGTILLLDQALRFLSYIDSFPRTKPSSKPILDALNITDGNPLGILGFSAGILTACVVAASPCVPSFIVNCVEAYRLALWIGIRSKIYQLSATSLSSGLSRPWSMVLIGITKNALLEAIHTYHSIRGNDGIAISITAVMSNDLFTVSGHPDALNSFSKILPQGITTCSININALYHCSATLQDVRNQILDDVISRTITFPKWSDLFTPIRCTRTGNLLDKTRSAESASLAETAIDMIMLHPVNWDLVIEKTIESMPRNDIVLLDIGLGPSLMKRLQSAAAQHALTCRTVDVGGYRYSKSEVKQDAIAIIGMAVHMPGAASVDELWALLYNGTNTSSEIPQSRFDYRMYTDGEARRSMKTRAGNFIDSVGIFDHKFFNISPREAKSMDPQQRILLQVAYHALEDAGYVPNGSRSFDPDTIGSFIGCATHDHIQNMKDEIDLYYSTGTLGAFLSGRLSYFLGLGGPSIVVDTACSSSLVAIHQASRALMNRDCHTALAGGVNIISCPDTFLGLDKGHFLSPSGQCKSFDADADGYSRGEGCGIFVLKRLEDAVAENDRILGVIRGVEINQSGKAHSITHPHGPTQKKLFEQLLKRSNIDRNSVNVVEAHGTGTQAGDTNEVDSIRNVLNVDRAPDNPLYITSIKANIGHLEAASGSASLAKVLMMLQHQIIPRQIFLQTLNPLFAPLDSDNTVIATDNMIWRQSCEGKARVALVNNFGAAGSNAALLVQEYQQKTRIESSLRNGPFVFGISAKDESALEKLRLQLVRWLTNPPAKESEASLADIAYTLTARRQIYPHRLAITASSKEDLIQKLQAAPTSDAPANKGAVVFVFSGQGCQYRGMGSALYMSSPIFRHHIDECDDILSVLGFPGIKGLIVDSGPKTGGETYGRDDFHSALFSIQYALLKVWLSWGIKPVAVVGHSIGEYAALVAAEVISVRDALLIVATRAQLMEERLAPEATGMVAISASAAAVQYMLNCKVDFAELSISCFNSPNDCVVSGPLKQLVALQHYMKRKCDWRTSKLDFPYAAHSPIMELLFDDLVNVSKTIRTNVPKVPLASTVLGRLVHAGERDFPPVDYFARQCINPVRFTEAIDSFTMKSVFPGDAIWLELGPHPSITPMLKSFPKLSSSVFLPSLRKKYEPRAVLSQSLASLYLSGYPVNWRKVFSDVGPVMPIALPSYPFAGPNFWVTYKESNQSQPSNHPHIQFSFLGSWIQMPTEANQQVAIFETPMQVLKEYIHGHLVGEIPLCPASVYLEMIYSGIALCRQNTFGLDQIISIQDITFCKALTWDFEDDGCKTVLILLVDLSSCSYTIKSRSPTGDETTHAKGKYNLLPAKETQSQLSLVLMPLISSLDLLLQSSTGKTPETFSTRTIYQVIFPRVVKYSEMFHSLQTLAMPPDDTQATGTMALASNKQRSFSIHPIFLDTLLHIAGFVANLQGGLNDAYICQEIRSVTVFSEHLLDPSGKYRIYCALSKCDTDHSEQGFSGESYAYIDGSNPPIVVAHMQGIYFQRVRLSGLQAGLASLAGRVPFGLPEQHDPRQMESPAHCWSTIQGIIAKNCDLDVHDIALEQKLDDLGIDSLMRLELASEISLVYRSFGSKPQEIALCKTTTDILNLVLPSTPGTPVPPNHEARSPRTPGDIMTPHSFSRTLVNRTDSSPPVRKIFANILDISEDCIRGDSELASLGFDSLASIEATHTFRHKYNLQIPKDLLSPQSTVREVERQMLQLGPSALPYGLTHDPFDRMCKGIVQRGSLSLLQNSTSKLAPLILIHDGSGLTVSYERLPTLDRRVWAITNPYFSSSRKWPGLTDMAKTYAKMIMDEIDGHIILGGWSFGGIVALEIAAHLSARTITVDGILLIDAPTPLSHVPLPISVLDNVLDPVPGLDRESKRLCKEQFRLNAELLRTYKFDPRNGYKLPRLILLRSIEPYMPLEQENVPSWLSDRSNLDTISSGWNIISGGRLLRALDIPGHHFSPFDPENVTVVSRKIQEACTIMDTMEGLYI